MALQFPLRRLSAVLVLSLAATLSGCKEDLTLDHAEVDFMRITVAGQAPVLVNATGTASATLTLTQGVATSVNVEFLDATQQDALGAEADLYQANITPAAGIAFARSNAFGGTLTASATGSISVDFAMFHLEDGEEEFGPFPVTFVVSSPPTVVSR